MKRLGLIGGTSWHSTIEYYRAINEAVNQHFGDNTNPPLTLVNLNQSQIHQHQRDDEWELIAELFVDACQRLIASGVDAIIFCANTPHRVHSQVQPLVSSPILHIADATADKIKDQKLQTVGFIGTKYSMEQDFVTGRIESHGIRVLTPKDSVQRESLHRIIQQELTFGKNDPKSKQFVEDVVAEMQQNGAEGIVLGCTEFPLMFRAGELELPTFNTTEIHAEAAVKFILSD